MSRSIEPPPPPLLSDHSFRSSKRRVYSGSSSHSFMDPDVIEIPPPINKPSYSMKQKEAMFRDAIDIDNDDDSTNLVLVGEKVGKSDKGKAIESIHGGYGDHQIMEVFDDTYCPPVMDKSGPSSMVESSNGYTSVSNNLISVDGHGSDQSCDDDDCSDFYLDDYMDVDDYALLQAHFDNANIPPGIETPIPWLTEYDLGSKKAESSSLYPCFHTQQSDSKNSHVNDLSHPTWSIEPIKPKTKEPSAVGSSLQTKMDAIYHPSKIDLSSQLFSQTAPSKKKIDATQCRRRKMKKFALGVKTSKSNWVLVPSDKKKPNGIGSSSANHAFVDNSEPMKLPHGGESPHWKLLESAKKASGSISTYHSNFIGPVDGSLPFPGTEFANPWLNSFHFNPFTNYTANSSFFNPFVPPHAPPEQVFGNTWAHNSARDGNNGTTVDSTVVTISDFIRDEIMKKFQNFKQFDTIEDTSDHYFFRSNSSMKQHSKNWVKKIQEEWRLLEKELPANSSFFNPFVPPHAPPEQVFGNTWAHNSARDGNNGTTVDSTVVTISDFIRDEIMKKFQNFKQFDTIEDTSDHYFFRSNSSMKQHSKNWVKKIQEEWRLLEKDLPDSIFVRVYESRIDLLRAVIIGAEGTPYHDGLFFFDVSFPGGYPNVPPQVHYHSGGLRLNPNLYNCGKVCLSLLNTWWSSSKNEKWLPGVSTVLQVLVSIQGLILNTKPYFNGPGSACLSGSADGEMRSLSYNEDTFLLSLKTMVYLIRRPPKNFEDLVIGHFCSRAHDILVACKAYMDGAQVGCLVKGGVQDVDQGDKSCSKEFKNALPSYVDILVKEFTQIGATDCKKFLSSSTARNKPLD